ncbi:MAG TPA: HU family DNA-binding protein [Blastocatellia bacterium]|nr:HU family DNA-binding protein [Blastocatellia bacterium]
MNKSHLIEKVAKELGISKVAADKAIDSILAGVSEGLRKGERVTFVGFGTFSLGERRARSGRNPQTGEPIRIESRKFVRFTTGKKLNRQVNNNKKRDN